MKKYLLVGLSLFVLAGCSSENGSEGTSEVSETQKVASNIESKAKELFGDDITFEVSEDTVTSDVQESHTEYVITLNNPGEIKEANDRIYSNQGTEEDKQLIEDVKDKAKELAQDIDNELDTVLVHYVDEDDNNIMVAYTQKSKSLID